MIADSELILNTDGSIYHLNLRPEDLAQTIILVGDPERLQWVSRYLDNVVVKKGKKDFITHTGLWKGQRISVISSGIGTDNIDIVLNELDALVNIDFETKSLKDDLTSLDIIRIGTSGSIQGNIAVGTVLASEYAIGFDALMQYYIKPYTEQETAIKEVAQQHFPALNFQPYVGRASTKLLSQFASDLPKGLTMTVPGFYGPQGRHIRSNNVYPDLIEKAVGFSLAEKRITHLEMETAGIYALANMFGHHALSINTILASRVNDQLSENPKQMIDDMIRYVLERV
ncbi:nucleoside phosphorylase [Parapedobacter sp. SGR-10]|uniref:nucleoside phosphorylase n=1 Tax=Parapedobacter sp. SGR-10 TaxID=2710879 RepID=UPI0013D4C5EF|nr:nucleoside phosphorylase [Parapedobacter sp. SGR-10]NGF58040.1 nucleoside phosphorylase [Parapedobacter sp. SGR-10]